MNFWSILRKGVQSNVQGMLVINPATAEPVVPLSNEQLREDPVPTMDAAYEPGGGKMLVGTAREKFFSNFFDFDTANDWEVIKTAIGGSVTGPLGGGVAGATPYLNIASGTTVGEQTVILSRDTFRSPVEVRMQVSASQRIINNALRIGFVEVDDDGAIAASTTYAAAPEVLNARNAAVLEFSGTTATSGTVKVRAAGAATDSLAAAFGAGFTTVATGGAPNFLAGCTYGLMMERDRINSRAWGLNASTNLGGQFAYDRCIPNPTKRYKLAIIVENGAVAPASSTDWRIHLINVMDATRFDISPRVGGTTDGAKAFPVWSTGGTVAVTMAAGVLAAGTAAIGDAGVQYRATATGAASAAHVVSAASTNATVIKAAAGRVLGMCMVNTAAAWRYIKLHNQSTAPTAGVTVARTFGIPPGGQCTFTLEGGIAFATGIGLTITAGSADADNTPVAAGDVIGELFFA